MESRLLKILSSHASEHQNAIATTSLSAIEADLGVIASMAGVHGMIAYLNARTRYRFTGIQPTESVARFSACLYDRETPPGPSMDFRDLYQVGLAIARSEGIVARGPRSLQLRDIPVSAIGAPLIGSDGVAWGVLCHFDPQLRAAPESETTVLRSLGSCAARWLEPRLSGPAQDQPVEL